MNTLNRNPASFALGAIALAISAAAPNFANAAVIFSSVQQSGFAFGFDPVSGMFTGLQSGGAYPLTAGAGFDFTAQDYASLTTIDKLTISLTLNDGDSDVGEFDFDNLTLGLDGVDTGLKLNGFPNDNLITLDIEGPTAAAATLLARLQEDGHLVATVIDPDGDGITQQNRDFIGFPNTQMTTLVIEGQSGAVIPLPAAALMAPLAAGLFTTASRRFRRAK